MKLEILSYSDAWRYEPKDKTYVIRIFNEFFPTPILDLEKGKDFMIQKKYFFDNIWPRDYREFSWVDVDSDSFNELFHWNVLNKKYPLMTKKSLMGYKESMGHSEGRNTLFNEDCARKIYTDFEEHKKNIENIMIHCWKGENRSPAVGIAMNETYNWKIKGLKEKFPFYRRFVYDIMKDVGEEFRKGIKITHCY